MTKQRLVVLVCLIFAAAASRLIPHPPNMASITAVALFGGAYRVWRLCFSRKSFSGVARMRAGLSTSNITVFIDVSAVKATHVAAGITT